MPNWCEGTLKVRGTIEALKKFTLNGLLPVDPIGQMKKPLTFDVEDDESFYIQEIKSALWIRETSRAFCEPDYIDVWTDTKTGKATMVLPFKQAWEIQADDLLSVCREYDVDMKVQGFERGQEFSQIIEIIGGEIKQNEEIKYDDWIWDCPCPEMGG